MAGFYIQAHSHLFETLLLSYGARYDSYEFEQKILLDNYYGSEIAIEPSEFDKAKLSVNAGLSYEFLENFTFSVGYAEASRGKEIGDGFTIDSYLYRDAVVVDPNLDIEQVTNVESSLEYAFENLTISLAAYQSAINDAIFARGATYENIGTVDTKGYEFDITYQFNHLTAFIGYSSTDTALEPADGFYSINYDSVPLNGYEHSGLGNSRGDTTNLGLNYTMNSQIELGINLAHVQSLTIETLHEDLDLEEELTELYMLKKPSYAVVDIFADWNVSAHVKLNLAITNLFDQLYRDHSSVGDYTEVPGYDLVIGPWEAGRDIRLSASFSF